MKHTNCKDIPSLTEFTHLGTPIVYVLYHYFFIASYKVIAVSPVDISLSPRTKLQLSA